MLVIWLSQIPLLTCIIPVISRVENSVNPDKPADID